MRPRYGLAFVGVSAVAFALICGSGATAAKPPKTAKREATSDSPVQVKLYAVADLVAPLHAQPGESARSSQVAWVSELQLRAEQRLSRLEDVVRLAVPSESWQEGGGPGALTGYPEKLCLVIRQTEAGHRAIEDLLRQLRKVDEVEIELQVASYTLSNLSDDKALEVLTRLGHALTAEELADFRRTFPTEQYMTSVRVRNGRTVLGGGILKSVWPRFTAVVAADRSSVELRLDNVADDMDRDGAFPIATQTHTIPVGRSAGLVVSCDGGEQVWLITPRTTTVASSEPEGRY